MTDSTRLGSKSELAEALEDFERLKEIRGLAILIDLKLRDKAA